MSSVSNHLQQPAIAVASTIDAAHLAPTSPAANRLVRHQSSRNYSSVSTPNRASATKGMNLITELFSPKRGISKQNSGTFSFLSVEEALSPSKLPRRSSSLRRFQSSEDSNQPGLSSQHDTEARRSTLRKLESSEDSQPGSKSQRGIDTRRLSLRRYPSSEDSNQPGLKSQHDTDVFLPRRLLLRRFQSSGEESSKSSVQNSFLTSSKSHHNTEMEDLAQVNKAESSAQVRSPDKANKIAAPARPHSSFIATQSEERSKSPTLKRSFSSDFDWAQCRESPIQSRTFLHQQLSPISPERSQVSSSAKRAAITPPTNRSPLRRRETGGEIINNVQRVARIRRAASSHTAESHMYKNGISVTSTPHPRRTRPKQQDETKKSVRQREQTPWRSRVKNFDRSMLDESSFIDPDDIISINSQSAFDVEWPAAGAISDEVTSNRGEGAFGLYTKIHDKSTVQEKSRLDQSLEPDASIAGKFLNEQSLISVASPLEYERSKHVEANASLLSSLENNNATKQTLRSPSKRLARSSRSTPNICTDSPDLPARPKLNRFKAGQSQLRDNLTGTIADFQALNEAVNSSDAPQFPVRDLFRLSIEGEDDRRVLMMTTVNRRRAKETHLARCLDVPHELRVLALEDGGLLKSEFRKLAWPCLLADSGRRFKVDSVETGSIPDATEEDKTVELQQKDHRQIDLDVARKYDEKDLILRERLRQFLHMFFDNHPDLSYFQGFHDLCALILRVFDDDIALADFVAFKISTSTIIRDAHRKTMDAVFVQLKAIHYIIECADPELAERIATVLGEDTFWAISPLTCLFSHDVSNPVCLERLIDACLASGPQFPLYLVATVALLPKIRMYLLSCDEDETNFLGSLKQCVRSLQPSDADEMVRFAQILERRVPANRVIEHCYRKLGLPLDSFLASRWLVKSKPLLGLVTFASGGYKVRSKPLGE